MRSNETEQSQAAHDESEISQELEALAQQFKSEEESDAPSAEQSDQESRKSEASEEYAALIQSVLTPTAALIVPNWKLSSHEIEGLSLAYGELLAKYFPDDGLKNWGAEITAVLVTVTVFGSRAGVPRVAKKEKEVNPKEKNAPQQAQNAQQETPQKPVDPSGVDVNQVISELMNAS